MTILQWFRRYRKQAAWSEDVAVYEVEPDEFDRIRDDLKNPSPPTESIKRGAELIRKLYHHT